MCSSVKWLKNSSLGGRQVSDIRSALSICSYGKTPFLNSNSGRNGVYHHYVLIRDLSALLSYASNHHGKIFPCPFCLYRFTVEATLEKHIPECGKHGVQGVSYPSPGSNILQFTNIANQMKVPFAIFADFESFLEKGEIEAGKTTKLID